MKRFSFLSVLLVSMVLCVVLAGCNLANPENSIPTTDPTTEDSVWDPNMVDIGITVGEEGDEVVEDACYLYTPQIVDETFRYLDEIYTDRYPEMALRWDRGVTADMRIFTAFAQQLTKGCTTDREKVSAIYDWIRANIEYKANCSPMSVDVLYNGHGSCLGQALLLQDLCRMVGVPAVFGDGFRGNMKTFTVEAMHNTFTGHAWCYVYVDGEWVLYDPVWDLKGTTDRAFIAEHYYVDMVGGITPIYDTNNMPPFRNPESVYAYMNGKYTLLRNGEISHIDGSSTGLNMAYNLAVDKHKSPSSMHYLDAPAYVYEGLEEDELYSNGWVAYGEPFAFTGFMHYFYENGLMASEVVIHRNGVDYYMDQGMAYKICMPQDVYTMRYGQIKIQTGYQGKIWEPSEEMLQGGTYTLEWSTDDPSVATIDQNGVVTNLKSGMVDIECRIIYQSTLPAVDVRVDDTFSWTVYFWDEPARPSEFETLDPGGPAGIVIQTDELGPRGITPIITDPEIWGDEQPSEGIQFGYPMIPTDQINPGFMMEDILSTLEPENGTITMPDMLDRNGLDILTGALQMVRDQNCAMSIPLQSGTMLIDQPAIDVLLSRASGVEGISLWLIPMEDDWCDFGQKEAVKKPEVEAVYCLFAEVWAQDGCVNDLQGGSVRVTVPIEAGGTYRVCFVDADGNFTEVPSAINGDTITFEAPYFATYAILNNG